MRNDQLSFQQLSDDQLLSEVTALAARERHATAQLIAALAEVDARRLYLGAGYSSLFTYCTQFLHLSEHAAYGRIEAARSARRLPRILDLLADGSITLTAVCLLAPHLTQANHEELRNAATHKTKREIEQQAAALRPLPPLPSTIRKLPAQAVTSPPAIASVSAEATVSFRSPIAAQQRPRTSSSAAGRTMGTKRIGFSGRGSTKKPARKSATLNTDDDKPSVIEICSVGDCPNPACFAALERLTAESWRRSG